MEIELPEIIKGKDKLQGVYHIAIYFFISQDLFSLLQRMGANLTSSAVNFIKGETRSSFKVSLKGTMYHLLSTFD